MGALDKENTLVCWYYPLIVIIVVSLMYYAFSNVLDTYSKPLAVHQMVSLHLEKQNHDEQQNEQKQFFHKSDLII